MNTIRDAFDFFYKVVGPVVFYLTRNDPEMAHELFVRCCRILYRLNLDKFVFDNDANKIKSSVKISNAAGLDKNCEIPPPVLGAIGFDRVVVGTVTGGPWAGNPRPRIIRYPLTQSLLNWMGLPGEGAAIVSARLKEYSGFNIPLTINFAPTPGKKGDSLLDDLKSTVVCFRDIEFVDRFELNISCPNTQDDCTLPDARHEYQKELGAWLSVTAPLLKSSQELYLKISPDIDETDIEDILHVVEKYRAAGFTLTNTTTRHDPAFIASSPGKGGASGDAVYELSVRMQRLFAEKMAKGGCKWRIIACGGINSVAKMRERIRYGADEIQLYTPMIFSGTGLVRILRKGALCNDISPKLITPPDLPLS